MKLVEYECIVAQRRG